jgi:hypothetical protein
MCHSMYYRIYDEHAWEKEAIHIHEYVYVRWAD